MISPIDTSTGRRSTNILRSPGMSAEENVRIVHQPENPAIHPVEGRKLLYFSPQPSYAGVAARAASFGLVFARSSCNDNVLRGPLMNRVRASLLLAAACLVSGITGSVCRAVTYGNTTPFGIQSIHASDYVLGVQVNVPQALELTSFGMMYGHPNEPAPSASNAIFGLYDSSGSGGNPGTLIAAHRHRERERGHDLHLQLHVDPDDCARDILDDGTLREYCESADGRHQCLVAGRVLLAALSRGDAGHGAE